MKSVGKILKGAVISLALVTVVAGGAFAGFKGCLTTQTNVGNSPYPNLVYRKKDFSNDPGQWGVKCTIATNPDDNKEYSIWGKTQKDCVQAGQVLSNLDNCKSSDLTTVVGMIINTILFVVGMVAVVMIILGGITYATSQGDPGKVKKGKDTILYGIIGLVISLLAFAIVTFVLNSLQ